MKNKYGRLKTLLFLFSETKENDDISVIEQLKEFNSDDIFNFLNKNFEDIKEHPRLIIIGCKIIIYELIEFEKGILYLEKLSKTNNAENIRIFISAIPYLFSKVNNKIKDKLKISKELKKYINSNKYDEIIKNLENEKNTFVISNLIIKISEFKRPDCIEIIAKFLKNSDPRVRSNSCEALGKFKEHNVSYLIIPFLDDKIERVRNTAFSVLKKLDKKEVIDSATLLISRKTKLKAAMLCIAKLNTNDSKRLLKSYLNHSDNIIKKYAAEILEDYLKETNFSDYIIHLITYNKKFHKYGGISLASIALIYFISLFFGGNNNINNNITYFSKNSSKTSSAKIDINKVAKTEKDRKILEYLEKAVVKEPDTPKFPSNTPRELKEIIIAETHPDFKKAAFAIANNDLSTAKSILENIMKTAGENTYLHLQAISSLIYIAQLENDKEALKRLKIKYFEMSNRSKLQTMNETMNLSNNEFNNVLEKMDEMTIKGFKNKKN